MSSSSSRLKNRNLGSSSSASSTSPASLESRINATSNRALDKLNTTFQNIKTNTLPNAETKIKAKLEEMTPVLTNAQLKNLDNHKYSASGATLLDPFFQIYWRWLVEQMPLWIAPNLLTVIGLIVNVLTSTILMLYSPNCDDNVNLYTYYSYQI